MGKRQREEERGPLIINIEPPKHLPGTTLGISLVVTVAVLSFFLCVCLVVLWFSADYLVAIIFPTPNLSPAQTPTHPAFTSTPLITPTPVPLPIREDFSQQFSDLWRVIGDPLIVENVERGMYNGVLTNRYKETSTLIIGNTAWNDYFITLKANTWTIDNYYENHITIGVRVIDLNNMITLDCDLGPFCTWAIISDGIEDRLPSKERMIMVDGMEIVVSGNTITAVAAASDGSDDGRMAIEIPSKYRDKFTGGGVMFRTTSVVEIDFIQIDPLP